MTETQPTPLSTADVKRRYSWGMAPHKSIPGGMYTVASAAADFDRWLTAHDAEVRADERAKLQDRIEELEKNLSYEVEQKIKLADTLRDERAKRPDREQIAAALYDYEVEVTNHGDCCYPWSYVSVAVRERYLGRADAVLSSLALEPEAREEAELFHDQDGDLWKFTDKGEWFHEEEPGEFRQVLSIDAEDQTLTPVGRAELAPAPEVADAEVEAAARVLFAREEPDMNDWRWSRPNPHTPDAPFEWHNYWLGAARAALEAAREVSHG